MAVVSRTTLRFLFRLLPTTNGITLLSLWFANAAGIGWYHNGAPVAAQSNNPTNRQDSLLNNGPLRIATQAANQPLSGWFRGDIDELEIFSRALTAAEVLSLFNAGTFGKCK